MEELAHTFHMSKSSLNKLFQKELNTTCHQYILKKRLALSIKLIRDNVPLKNVATQVGFKDYSTFFRAFKKIVPDFPDGMSGRKQKKFKHNKEVVFHNVVKNGLFYYYL